MTPKELIAAAGVLAYEARGHSGSPRQEMRLASQWIAATVRADDDELITLEWLKQLGKYNWFGAMYFGASLYFLDGKFYLFENTLPHQPENRGQLCQRYC